MKFYIFILFFIYIQLVFSNKLKEVLQQDDNSDAEQDNGQAIDLSSFNELGIIAKKKPFFYHGEPLPITPKGMHLINHFGGHPIDSPFGPQPTVILQDEVTVDQEGRIDEKVGKKIIHTSIPLPGQPCEIQKQHNFEFCFMLYNCDLCKAYSKCGWCEATHRCLPGNDDFATCKVSCINGWIYGSRSCDNNLMGKFDNVAPEAMGVINPELTGPKYDVKTIITHPAIVKTPVLLGTKLQKYNVTTSSIATGQIISQTAFELQKPILGEISQIATVNTEHEQFIDAATHKRLDRLDPLTYHGFERDSPIDFK